MKKLPIFVPLLTLTYHILLSPSIISAPAAAAAGSGGVSKLLLKPASSGGSSSGSAQPAAPAAVTKHKGGGSSSSSRVALSTSGSGGHGGIDGKKLLQQLQSLASHPSVVSHNIPPATIDKRLTKFYRETFGEVLRRVREHYVISVFPPYPR